jgi:hypothetical protein
LQNKRLIYNLLFYASAETLLEVACELRQQVGHLKRLVADKTLEADFFKGCEE